VAVTGLTSFNPAGFIICALENNSKQRSVYKRKYFLKRRVTQINLLPAKIRFCIVKGWINDKI